MWKRGEDSRFVKLPLLFLLLSFGCFVVSVDGLWCDRAPAGVNVPKSPGDDGYKIAISGDPDKPDKYIPEAVYTVRLQGPGDQYTVKKFSGFLLVAEPADGLSPETSAGSFQLIGDSLARFSEYCPHAVKHASELPKAEVQVRWTAPPASAGCVSFRQVYNFTLFWATIIKNKGKWFMDDGELTKTLCPETDVGPDESETSEPCCACDEAKYELTFEGLWSALTHPKDFPADAWSAHFSDIIGASHSPTFRFWKKDGIASEGLKQFAESGDSKDLESELKAESGSIRTIIKARGLRHPNFYGHKTFAVFRADKEHNLISLVSKIAPSPDWFVGVSGLNLCMKNCSWLTNKVLPLYPWDAGTDNGITYLSPKESTIPRDRIHGITWQEDDRSPFFDASGNMVKPFARLRISKQRSYEKTCPEHMEKHGAGLGRAGGGDYDEDDQYDDFDDRDRPECEMTDWSMWSTCNSAASCGPGIEKSYRNYKNEAKAIDLGCNRQRTRERQCDVPCSSNYDGYPRSGYRGGSGSSNSAYPVDQGMDPCAVSEFHPWGGCSVTCGQGLKRRFREFLYPSMARSHACDTSILADTERCLGAFPNCMDAEEIRPGCETTDWAEWGPCNATCGKGIQIRTRRYVHPPPHTDCRVDLYDDQSCEGTECTPQEICTQSVDIIKCRGSYTKWHYDVASQTCKKFSYGGCGGTQNIFETKEDCEDTCGSITELPSDSLPGYHHRHQATFQNQNQPSSSSRYHQHHNQQHNSPYSSSYQNYGPVGGGTGRQTSSLSTLSSSLASSSSNSYSSYLPAVDCDLSEWTPWSKCSVACGRGHKYRTRYIKVPSQNGGAPCPNLEHKRKCKGTQCPPNHPFRYHHHQSPSYDG
ncbi:Spondin-1 [Orchesella cincta]|uniref:Spondin-1 n=1 Tax=Orchesella cincta TaxID=48709 RepID=A0A1D2MTU1_ORCCI|nr:Spondin-1 [Orchesella cincta]